MGIITREQKGSKLTIQEMDGNLEYLQSVGIESIQNQGQNVILQRTNLDQISLTLPVQDYTDLESYISYEALAGNSSSFYQGVLFKQLDPVSSTVQLEYNTGQGIGVRSTIDAIYGRSYYLIGNAIISRYTDDFSVMKILSLLYSNKNYTPPNPKFSNSTSLSGFSGEYINFNLAENSDKVVLSFGTTISSIILDFKMIEIIEF